MINIPRINFEKFFSPIIAIIVIWKIFDLFTFIVSKPVEQVNRDIIMILCGGFLGALTTILGYYFGSSYSSYKKSEKEDIKENK